ncbi:DUF6477 family protein [Roseitranquillus sediminis]|uniref:DUF6477 family protein n=1 Tax=Roseitranquillus sediminis TaxID=2809051 RepID=UPI001D0CCD4E|nr:DUF6477 family protein [Roseitranquillus sediminis]MBM9595538.1 hypothetical protein [Roseitranquillus sediminis]
MTNLTGALNTLRRPRLLIRAARFGLRDYNRERDLKRLMKAETLPAPTRAISSLIAEEARIEETRRARDAAYSPARHVELLIALIAEARLLPRIVT